MSPEHIEGRKDLTFHSDMYSLGVVLYELLTGRKPFTGSNLEELISRIRKHDAVPPSAVRAELPKELDAVVLRALKKQPLQRYQAGPTSRSSSPESASSCCRRARSRTARSM